MSSASLFVSLCSDREAWESAVLRLLNAGQPCITLRAASGECDTVLRSALSLKGPPPVQDSRAQDEVVYYVDPDAMGGSGSRSLSNTEVRAKPYTLFK